MGWTGRVRATHEQRGNVVVQDLTDWDGEETAGMGTIETTWTSIARQPHITAAVTEFSADMRLGRETQEYLARKWSANAKAVGLDRIAFVSRGLKARAVSATLDVGETRAFDSLDEAVAWARRA